MTDSPVAGLDRLINTCRILFTEGKDLRTPEAGIEWQGRADRVEQEAKAWITAWSPDEAVKLETLGPYSQVVLSPDHPWWKPTTALGLATCTSSVLCEENNPVSYHLALLNELKEIVSGWRAKAPIKPIKRFAFLGEAKRAYSERVKSAPPRHALLAENLGKPSLWVNIQDLWY